MAELVGTRLVAEAKITGYLLDDMHPVGGAKARFFAGFGFDREAPAVLIAALLAHPDRNRVARVEITEFGEKSIVECQIDTPDARNPCIRSVWFREAGTQAHRFVTSYPHQPD